MAQEIYNEGRVVGLSAWEIFAKTAIANGVDPSVIPSEAQWLTSMIGSGASMVLKLNAGTTAGVHDYELPQTSNLTAAGVVIGSPFIGDCDFVGGWATKVNSYGALIQNDSTDSPTSTTVPSTTYDPDEYRSNVSEFAKISDGVVYTKSATWIPTPSDIQTADGEPQKDIDPDFNVSTTVVRLYIDSDLNNDVMILLTGFNNKRILQGLSGFAAEDGGVSAGGSTDVDHNDWANGGMLGPEMIPWASKIIFAVPNSTYNFANSMTRTLPKGVNASTVTAGSYNFTNLQDSKIKANSVVDFNSIDLTQYYTVNSAKFTKVPTITEDIQEIGVVGDSANVLLAWYPGITATELNSGTLANSSIFPPALYAAKVTQSGDTTLVPIDVAAPGTVKGFSDSVQAYNYKVNLPDNYAIYYDKQKNTFSFVTSNSSSSDSWSGTAKLDYLAKPTVMLTAGTQTAKLVSLTNPDTKQDYTTTGSSGSITTPSGTLGKVTWDRMLKALYDNLTLDTLGDGFRNIGTEVNASNTIGISSSYTNKLTNLGTDKLTIVGSNPVGITTTTNQNTKLAKLDDNTSIKVGTNFIEFGSGIRLYISTSDPGNTNVPVGSIGIGW